MSLIEVSHPTGQLSLAEVADALATILVQALVFSILACGAFVAAVLIYGWAWNAWDAHELRRQTVANHELRRRATEIAQARRETRAIPADREHPLHTLGGRFR